jgi:hypothetical protein
LRRKEALHRLPALVLGVEATFPTGNRTLGLGDEAYELAPYLALLKQFGPICVQGNVAWDKQVSAQCTDERTYGWAVSTPLVRDKLHLLAEIQGDWGSPNHTTFAPGINRVYLRLVVADVREELNAIKFPTAAVPAPQPSYDAPAHPAAQRRGEPKSTQTHHSKDGTKAA